MADAADSEVKTSQSSAGTGATQADVGAAVRAAEAAAQTAASQAAQTAASQAAATGALAQEETVADVGQGEAYILNMKKLVEDALDLGKQLNQTIVTAAQRISANSINFDEQVKNLSLNALVLGQAALKDAVALSNRVNNQAITDDVRANDNAGTFDRSQDTRQASEGERTVRQGDWAINLDIEAVAKNPVFQDAIAGAVAKGVADALKATKA